jgi:bacillithiol system protein YtxJ
MEWNEMTTMKDLTTAIERSHEQPVALFKHSTRCPVSSMAKRLTEQRWNHPNVAPYLLDLIAYRDVSNAISDQLGIDHESPQLLLLKRGVATQVFSHSSIDPALLDATFELE